MQPVAGLNPSSRNQQGILRTKFSPHLRECCFHRCSISRLRKIRIRLIHKRGRGSWIKTGNRHRLSSDDLAALIE